MDPLQTSTDADATDDATDATDATGVTGVTGGYGGTVSTLRCSVPDRNRNQEVNGVFSTPGNRAANATTFTDKPDDTNPNQTLVEMMPKQAKIYGILKLIEMHQLHHDLDTKISPQDFGGLILLCGAQSTGKTSTLSRLIGCDALVSTQKLGTRAPLLITCVNSNVPTEQISLVLPEVRKGQNIIHAKQSMVKLTDEECHTKIKGFHDVIRQEKGEQAIISEEIQLYITSNYVPTMILLDLPGLPITLNGRMNKVSNDILKKYLNGKKFRKIHPILCSSAMCDTPVPNFVAAMKKMVEGNILSDPIFVVTKIDRSKDPDWEGRRDEDNPEEKKDGPLWRLSELVSGRKAIVGLLNKDTTLVAQTDIRTREQVEKEEAWIKQRRLEGHITDDTASKLGLKVLAEKYLDICLLSHLEGFIKKNKAEAVSLKQNVDEDISMLGTPPAEIDLDDLKGAVQKELESVSTVQEAAGKMQGKIMECWKEKIYIARNCADGKSPDPEECLKIAREIYLGGEFGSETEEIMAARVREPFENDNKGHMQIGRFHSLRDHYVMESRSLAAEYFTSFKGRVASMFNIFEELVWMTEGVAKVDNLIKGVIKCHKTMLVEPLFANLHGKVCDDGSIWRGKPVEKHAGRREALGVKSRALRAVIAGWDELLELIPDEIEEARKSPSPTSPPAPSQRSSARKSHRKKNARKRTNEDDGEDVHDKFPRITYEID